MAAEKHHSLYCHVPLIHFFFFCCSSVAPSYFAQQPQQIRCLQLKLYKLQTKRKLLYARKYENIKFKHLVWSVLLLWFFFLLLFFPTHGFFLKCLSSVIWIRSRHAIFPSIIDTNTYTVLFFTFIFFLCYFLLLFCYTQDIADWNQWMEGADVYIYTAILFAVCDFHLM